MKLSRALFAVVGLALGVAVAGAPAHAQEDPNADSSGTVVISEDTGFPGVCDQPCYEVEKIFNVYLSGNPDTPAGAGCAAGENTYIYTLEHVGGTGTPIGFIPDILGFKIDVDTDFVGAGTGFIAGGGVDPSAVTIDTVADEVRWDFLDPTIPNGSISSQLVVCSTLTPGTVTDNVVAVAGAASLDAPGTCVGPLNEANCELKVEKFCEVLDDGGDPDKDKDKDLDGIPDRLEEDPYSDTLCVGRLSSMVIEYTGQGCDAGNNPQSGRAVCRGGQNGAYPGGADNDEPVRVVVTNGRGNVVYGDHSGMMMGDEMVISAEDVGRASIHGTTKIRIYDGAGARIELVRFKTNCSENLDVGDDFGSFGVNEFSTTSGNTVTTADMAPPAPTPTNECVIPLPRVDVPGDKDKDKDMDGANPGAEVKYTYRIMNTGTVTATDVTVIDDQIGEVMGSPIASIDVDETVELMETVLITEDTVNTVTVTGQPGSCMDTASASVTLEQPGDVPDKDKDKDKDKDNDD